jgi:hypothetical protein
MIVRSLSWQNDQFYIKTYKDDRFLTLSQSSRLPSGSGERSSPVSDALSAQPCWKKKKKKVPICEFSQCVCRACLGKVIIVLGANIKTDKT